MVKSLLDLVYESQRKQSVTRTNSKIRRAFFSETFLSFNLTSRLVVCLLFLELPYTTEDVCLLKMLEGMCVRCLKQNDLAEVCFKQVLVQ